MAVFFVESVAGRTDSFTLAVLEESSGFFAVPIDFNALACLKEVIVGVLARGAVTCCFIVAITQRADFDASVALLDVPILTRFSLNFLSVEDGLNALALICQNVHFRVFARQTISIDVVVCIATGQTDIDADSKTVVLSWSALNPSAFFVLPFVSLGAKKAVA